MKDSELHEIVQKESREQRAAFELYYKLGVERSYTKVAVDVGKSISTIEKWGKMYSWQARVEKRDAQQRTEVAEREKVEGEVDFIQRDLTIVKGAILAHMRDIKSGKMKTSYKSLEDLIRLEVYLRMGIEPKLAGGGRAEIKTMSNEQLAEKLDRLMNSVKDLPAMQNYNQIKRERIIDAEFTPVVEKEEGTES